MNTAEDIFWELKPQAIQKGITPARLGQLAKLCENYERATEVLQMALKAKKPSTYLGAVVSNIRQETIVQHSPPRSNEPEIVLTARLRGWQVRKTVLGNGKPGWWVCGVLYNERGNDVGG